VVTRPDLPNATAVSTPASESVRARPAIATAKPSDRRRADRDLESEEGPLRALRALKRPHIGFSSIVSSYTCSNFVLSKMSSLRVRPVIS